MRRRSEKEFCRFLDVAFSSARELGYYISLACRLGYLSEEGAITLESLQGRVSAALAGLINAVAP